MSSSNEIIMTIKIDQKALNSLLTSFPAKKAIEQELVANLSNIKCPQHHCSPTNIQVIGHSVTSLKATVRSTLIIILRLWQKLI
jgi:hypothetical protein